MTTAATIHTVISSISVELTPAGGVSSFLIRIPELAPGESITVPVGRTAIPKEGPPTAFVISRVPYLTRESPPETTAVSPAGWAGAQPLQQTQNAKKVSPGRAGTLPSPLPLIQTPPFVSAPLASKDRASGSRPSGSMQCTPRHDGQSCVESGPHQVPIRACIDLFPGANPNFVHYELVKSDTSEHNMEAARRIACILAMHGIPAYESVYDYLYEHRRVDIDQWNKNNMKEPTHRSEDICVRAIQTLATIADIDIIPEAARKAAAQCGGEPRGGDDECPKWAVPDKECCYALMQKLIPAWQTSRHHPPQRSINGYESLQKYNPDSCSEVIRAYLAAADASKCLIQHIVSGYTLPWRRNEKDLEGGTCCSGDEVSKYIINFIHLHHEKTACPAREAKV